MMGQLEQLVQDYLDDEISREDFDLLQSQLRTDEEARNVLYEHVRLKRLIQAQNAFTQGEMIDLNESGSERRPSRLSRRLLVGSATGLVASFVLVAFLLAPWKADPVERKIQLSGSPNSSWTIGTTEGETALAFGQVLEVREGIVSVTFPSGTTVTGRVPMALEVLDPDTVRLLKGEALFDIAKGDEGFRVHTPRARFVDLGTRFGVSAHAAQGDELHVIEGVVQLDMPEDQSKITDRRAVGMVNAGESPFPIRYEGFRFASDSSSDYSYVHWSFDEPDGALEVVARGTAPGVGGFSGLIVTPSGDPARGERTDGAFASALKFNGEDFVHTAYPGVGNQAARTVAFWYRDRAATGPLLDNPYHEQPLVMWGYPGGGKQLEYWAIKIRRHRSQFDPETLVFRLITNPTGRHTGPDGHEQHWLSTGEVPLDNEWHHYATVYTGPEGDDRAGRVLHYRDGLLLDEMKLFFAPSTPLVPHENQRLQPVRFGSHWGLLADSEPARKEGEIDEVYIIHAALDEKAIRNLMNTNKL